MKDHEQLDKQTQDSHSDLEEGDMIKIINNLLEQAKIR